MIPESSDDIKLLGKSLIEKIKRDAHKSPRKRMNFNFHPTLDDSVHRFLNVFTANTYIRPHRHLEPPKSETFVVLSGVMAFFIFNEKGMVEECHRLEATPWYGNSANEINQGIDIREGIWHTLIPITREVVCFEVKKGPYQPISDKEFAAWAPAEGEKRVAEYLLHLKMEARRVLNLAESAFQW